MLIAERESIRLDRRRFLAAQDDAKGLTFVSFGVQVRMHLGCLLRASSLLLSVAFEVSENVVVHDIITSAILSRFVA